MLLTIFESYGRNSLDMCKKKKNRIPIIKKIKSLAPINEFIRVAKFHILLVNGSKITLKICQICINICQDKKHH